MSARISVLLPYRDARDTLLEAVESILTQRDVDLELLAVDDGSTDGGARFIAEAATRDGRIRALETGGVGIVGALRMASRAATGQWLARMDADDLCAPDRLSAQLALLESDPRLAAVGTRVSAFGETDVGEGLRRYVEWQNALVTPEEHERDIFVESPLCHPSIVFRREAFEDVGGYVDTPWAEDYDLLLRLVAAGHRLSKVPRTLVSWRHRDGRLTFRDARYSEDRFREAKAKYLAPRLAAWNRPVAVWGAGPTGRKLARALEPHGIAAHRFIDIDPRKIGGVARGVPIVGPESLERGAESVVVSVGSRGARALIREQLVGWGFVEGSDFVCAA